MDLRSRWERVGCQVDRMLISSFVPPYVMSFSIALVVLIMQFLWRFIDDIIGKGVGALVIMEMFFYKSISLFPLALPIAVLLASVMVLGNLAERYELSSFKSAGVPLTRILRPLFLFCCLVALFSFYCSNTMIPIANLKYQSRLYDIRNHKPTLSIEAGVFNEDFKGYAIRVGKKHRDKETIEDIMVYDDSQRSRGQLNVVTARTGRMYVAEEDGAFVLTLYDGYQYAEGDVRGREGGLPFSVTHFTSWTRRFDLGEFDLDRTEEDQWKSHHTMKSARQIAAEIDTMDAQILQALAESVSPLVLWSDTAVVPPTALEGRVLPDSARLSKIIRAQPPGRPVEPPAPAPNRFLTRYHELMNFLDTLPASVPSLAMALPPGMQREYRSQLTSKISTTQTTADRNERTLHRLELNRRKHVYELHWKFSLAMACVVMLMIGGPMGTIVRKGGFGYPLLVSIIFFTFFIMSNISCKKLNDTEKLDPVLAAWLPVILLSVISAFLTYKALNDSKWVSPTLFKTLFSRLGITKKPAVA